MVFSGGNIKAELLKTLPLHGKTTDDIFQSFYANLLEMNVPNHKLVSMTIDGALAMTSENVGLIGLCKEDSAFPDFFSYHCVTSSASSMYKSDQLSTCDECCTKNCKLIPC
jgi:hypothetical protein